MTLLSASRDSPARHGWDHRLRAATNGCVILGVAVAVALVLRSEDKTEM
jgi:hypothetical protein